MRSRVAQPSERDTSQRVRLLIAIFTSAMLIIAASPFASTAEDGDTGQQTETAAEEPTPTPVPPTPTPVPPTPTPVPPTPTPTPIPPTLTPTPVPPTSTLEPTQTPVPPTTTLKNEPNPTDSVVSTESTATAGATEKRAAPGSPVASTTTIATASATPAPETRLSYDLADKPDCELAPDQPRTMTSGGYVDYVCQDHVDITGTDTPPSSVELVWKVEATIGGGWHAQLLPPAPTPDEREWTTAGASEARFLYRQPEPAGTSDTLTAFESTPSISYRVRIHRSACAEEPQTLQLDREVAVLVADTSAEITDVSSNVEPLRIKPRLAPIPEPSVAFEGALDFGAIGVTATGAEEPVRHGTLAITISELDQSCGAWTLRLSATPLTDGDGLPMEGSRLLAVSINDELLPDGGCDLTSGCAPRTFSAGEDAPSSLTVTLGVELRMPERPSIGSFETSLSATLVPEEEN